MKIKLLRDIPVDDKHGLVKGRVLNVIDDEDTHFRGRPKWWVFGDNGERIGVKITEAEVYDEC